MNLEPSLVFNVSLKQDLEQIKSLHSKHPVPSRLKENISKYNWHNREYGGPKSRPPDIILRDSEVEWSVVFDFEWIKFAFILGNWKIERYYGLSDPAYRRETKRNTRTDQFQGIIWVGDHDWMEFFKGLPEMLYECSKSKFEERNWGDLILTLIRERERARDDWLCAGLLPLDPNLEWLGETKAVYRPDYSGLMDFLDPPFWREQREKKKEELESVSFLID